ncbi:MAG TPA: hypothetical protein VEA80_10425 [Vitreimonas sp.]|uniref:hypothetical protein n=1 Tax=Vitreimonas sp. TaxID=3069702 RepID=UPI002D4D7CB2|nr:hypothetical protein [Vitreimonas sp.]HYD87881.1 hypothetical protein [Vitreimonas sp.]
MLGLGLAAGLSACGYGHRGFYELTPERQFKVTIDEGAREALLRFIGEFANEQGFTVYRDALRSASSAPSVLWTLEQFKGMIVFQNTIEGQEPDPEFPGQMLNRHSQTDFRAWFYRSMFGYSEDELTQMISRFGAEVSAVSGVREFVDQFPRATR